MKAYKATYDYKCLDQTYEVGKTYSIDKLELCKYGFHYCNNQKDTLNHYPYKNKYVLLEVEPLGIIINDGDKSVTDKIKILRVIPREEYDLGIEFDDRGNMISMTYSDGSKYTYEYDERDNMISKTDSDGRKYTYEYDERNNMISLTYSNGRKITWEYDERNNMISSTDSDGRKYTYEYDERNNMISKTYSDGDKITWEVPEIANVTVED